MTQFFLKWLVLLIIFYEDDVSIPTGIRKLHVARQGEQQLFENLTFKHVVRALKDPTERELGNTHAHAPPSITPRLC